MCNSVAAALSSDPVELFWSGLKRLYEDFNMKTTKDPLKFMCNSVARAINRQQ